MPYTRSSVRSAAHRIPAESIRAHLVRLVASVLIGLLAHESSMLAVDSKGATYFGGTATPFLDAKSPVDGTLDIRNDQALGFRTDQSPFAGVVLWIPYDRIIELEYGQKAGRRVGATIGTSLLIGPFGLVTLFSKKRNHFLTIAYKGIGAEKDQVVVIELGKDIVRTTLPIVETRSGKKVQYQDEDARKSAK